MTTITVPVSNLRSRSDLIEGLAEIAALYCPPVCPSAQGTPCAYTITMGRDFALIDFHPDVFKQLGPGLESRLCQYLRS